MSGAELTLLAEQIGGLERHAPVDLDGHEVSATFVPREAGQVGTALAAISEAGLVAVPRGGGQHLAFGNPPARADLFLSTERLDAIEALEPAEGVCRVGAGVRLGVLREAAGAHGAEIPLDGPDAATVGGALAAASVGPRSHGFGRARDAVLGLDVTLGSGESTRCGGRVVKNVTGYDLAKLYTGSLGTLGVITAAWLRMRSLPEARQTRLRACSSLDDAVQQAVVASRRASVRACALRWDGKAGFALLVELGGDAAVVSRDGEALGGDRVDEAEIAALSALQWGEGSGLRVRIAALSSELAQVMRPLGEAGGQVLAYPGPGLVFGIFPASAAGEGEVAALRAAERASGPLRWEALPSARKNERCVFGAPEQEIALFRALKRRFDPAGALCRGRFAGRL